MFQQTLEEQVAKFVAGTLDKAEVPADLLTFVEWSAKNPPAVPQHLPKEGSVTRQVFDYCNTLKGEGKKVVRGEVIKHLTGLGLNIATVQTQFQRWYKTQPKAEAPATAPVATPSK